MWRIWTKAVQRLAKLAIDEKKSTPVSSHPRSITVVALGLLTACGQAMGSGPIEFKCDSPSPPFDKGQTYTVILNPGSNYVDVGQYQFSKDTVSKEKLQQGWTRWITNADREGKANSWTELNIKTGELKDIGINGQVELRSRCSQITWSFSPVLLLPINGCCITTPSTSESTWKKRLNNSQFTKHKWI